MAACSEHRIEGWVAIVDDDDSIRRSLARLFRLNGIAARTYGSAEAYLSRGAGDEPFCLVLDVQLGGLSGFELQDRLDAQGITPPIIFITALEGITSAELEGRSGPHGYLRKPFEAKTLLALVGQHASVSRQPHDDASIGQSASA